MYAFRLERSVCRQLRPQEGRKITRSGRNEVIKIGRGGGPAPHPAPVRGPHLRGLQWSEHVPVNVTGHDRPENRDIPPTRTYFTGTPPTKKPRGVSHGQG